MQDNPTFDTANKLHPIVVEAVQYLAGNEEVLGQFLALTGMDASDLVANIAHNSVQIGLLDFFLNHEPSLLAFCANRDIEPETVVKLHALMSGDQSDERSI